jgi:lycopene cyclase domain-containing protein
MPTYLIIDLLTLAGPLLLSFDKKVAFYKSWSSLIPAIGCMMLVFIPWDIWFTQNGYWGFNPEHLTGIWIFGLPLEEWLFFVVVPYACVFVYACIKVYFPALRTFKINSLPVILISGVSIITSALFWHQWYTVTAFAGAGILLIWSGYKQKSLLSVFLVTYVICLVPFILVNGVLTGTGVDQPVVWYQPEQHLGYRFFTIPVNDFVYNFLMLLLTVVVYETLEFRRHRSSAH